MESDTAIRTNKTTEEVMIPYEETCEEYSFLHVFSRLYKEVEIIIFKDVKKYGIYAVVLFLFLFLILALDYFLQTQAQQSYQMMPVMIYNFTVYPLVGCMVGMLALMEERNKDGIWRVNAGKLLLLALPAFFFAYYPYLVYFSGPFQFLEIPIPYFNRLLINIQISDFVFQFVMGYFLVTSFYKEEPGDNEQPLLSQ